MLQIFFCTDEIKTNVLSSSELSDFIDRKSSVSSTNKQILFLFLVILSYMNMVNKIRPR